MRRVNILTVIRREQPLRIEKIMSKEYGYFHEWGTDYEELQGGVGQFPIAIIEKDDGTIVTPHAELIKFVD